MQMNPAPFMQSRLELARMIDDLGRIAVNDSPVMYLDALDSIRAVAVEHGANLLADVLGRLESDLHGAFQHNAAKSAVESYREWIDLALGAAQQDRAMREALFAAMAVRRGAA